jgi:energy-coupling factor transporter ATP-binding protein EcfA2
MWFVVAKYGKQAPASPAYPYVRLTQDNWDDYGYKTTFAAVLFLSADFSVELGNLKILKLEQESGFTPVPDKPFQQLSDDFGSLGADLDYYDKLMKLGEQVYRPYLAGLQDLAFNDERYAEFEDEPGFRVSLLRFSGAERTLKDAAALLRPQRGQRRPASGVAFRLRTKLGASARSVTAGFDFAPRGDLPHRTNVVIGYNGSGKTRLLSNLATVASGFGYDRKEDHLAQSAGKFLGDPPPFGSVMVISYSAFDSFAIPGGNEEEREKLRTDRTFFGYVYCGLRELTDPDPEEGESFWADHEQISYRLKRWREIRSEFREALVRIHELDRRDEFRDILKPLFEDASFERVSISSFIKRSEIDSALATFMTLSSGHKIVLKIAAELTAFLDSSRPTLVLIDEPETHLHPPLLAALLRCIRNCLERFDAYAVVATHSPVVLQETPARYVRYVKRIGNRTSILSPRIETFGEDIGVLTQDVFHLDEGRTDWHATLRDLAQRVSEKKINDLFDGNLGFTARSYVISVAEDGDDEARPS